MKSRARSNIIIVGSRKYIKTNLAWRDFDSHGAEEWRPIPHLIAGFPLISYISLTHSGHRGRARSAYATLFPHFIMLKSAIRPVVAGFSSRLSHGVAVRAMAATSHAEPGLSIGGSEVHGFVGAVGNTPLIRLAKLSDETGCNILAKAEFMSPGGSIKDRAALFLVKDAEAKGLLQPGGTVVEGTAGNTGIGLAHVCRSKGYKCVIYMPDTQVSSVSFERRSNPFQSIYHVQTT